MKLVLIGSALMMAATGAAAPTVEVGDGDWSEVPAIKAENGTHFSKDALDRLHKLADAGTCEVPGFRGHSINLRVPLVIKFHPRGGVERIVLRKLNCPQLESLLGTVARQMALSGEWRSTGENQTGWYRSELTLNSR